MSRTALEQLQAEVAACRACPRLVAWREQVASDKRAQFREDEYWGRAVPPFGDPAARIVVLGLAPAAHGANRTGRMFTGDRSGDWLFRAMHRAGLASQPTSVARDDGLTLRDAWVTAAVRCAPPDNKPLPGERDACASFLSRELALLRHVRVIVCLGAFALDAAARHFGIRPKPRFGHLAEFDLADFELPDFELADFELADFELAEFELAEFELAEVELAEVELAEVELAGLGGPGRPVLLCSFHPSQQNTFTGRLTEPMLDAVFTRARELADRAA